MKPILKKSTSIGLIIGSISIALLSLYCLQRKLVYNPSHVKPTREAFHAQDMQRIQLQTVDKLQLNAWYKPAQNGGPTVIIFHGNAGHIGTRMPLARKLIQKKLGVLLFDYRGYGGNSGHPSEQGLYDDARAGMHFLKSQHVKPEKIVLYGESIGTGVAVKMAMEYPKACALILQSPYTRLSDLGKYHYPWIPIAPWDKFDSLGRISSIHIPLLAFHGTDDKVVPYTQGLSLFKAANPPKQWERIPGKGHGGLWDKQFINTVDQFITSHCDV